MRIIVIGDIHGCHEELEKMITDLQEKKYYDPITDKLIFLGDYIDRGPAAQQTISYIKNIQDKYGSNVVPLKGNHEDMMISYWDDSREIDWLYNGSDATRRSYMTYSCMANDIDWMRQLPVYHEDANFIYVHAGIDPCKSMQSQSVSTMLWVRETFILSEKKTKKRVIFGHTPTPLLTGATRPYITKAGHVDIDTGCVFSGVLTALIIDNDTINGYYQISRTVTNKLNGRYYKWDHRVKRN